MAEEIEAKLKVEIDPMSDKKTKTETKTKTAKADDKVDKKVNESFVDTDKQEDTIPNVEPYTSKDAKRASDQKVEKRRKAVSKEKKEDDENDEDEKKREKLKSSKSFEKKSKKDSKEKNGSKKEDLEKGSKKDKKKKKIKSKKVDPDWDYEGKTIGEIIRDLEDGIVPKAESKIIKRWLKEVRLGQEKIDEDFLKKTMDETVHESKKRKGLFRRIKQFFLWIWKKIKSIFKRNSDNGKSNKKKKSSKNKFSKKKIKADSKPKRKNKKKQGQGKSGDETIRDMVYDKLKKKVA